VQFGVAHGLLFIAKVSRDIRGIILLAARVTIDSLVDVLRQRAAAC
jgi:hypothetical protein